MPICTLVVQLHEHDTFQFSYTAENGHAVALGQFSIALSKLLVASLENATVQIPTTADRAAQAAEVAAETSVVTE